MDRINSQTESSFIESDLLQMQLAPNYNQWMFSLINPHLGKRILEIGSGIGTLTARLLAHAEMVCALEPNPYCASHLRSNLDQYPQLVVLDKTLEDCALREFETHKFDTILCCNVLEHIKNDLQALMTFREILAKHRGKAILWVPAVPSAYGPIDKVVGHYRRYSRSGLLDLVRDAGMHPVMSRYVNIVGLLGWLVNAHVRCSMAQSDSQILLFNRLAPFLSMVEKVIHPPIGMSLLVIAEVK